MPPLPSSRITKVSPFSNEGINYFGPVFIKHQDSNRKAWVCLFVCIVTRTLHMELAAEMTAAEFSLSFRCFAARYGTPRRRISRDGLTWHLRPMAASIASGYVRSMYQRNAEAVFTTHWSYRFCSITVARGGLRKPCWRDRFHRRQLRNLIRVH